MDQRNQKHLSSFYQRITRAAPLAIKIGKGGLSFYKEIPDGSVFVCHFNAKPQSNKNDAGFADFRYDAIHSMQKTAPRNVVIKVNKLWCSLHFPLNLADDVADLFIQHIVTKLSKPPHKAYSVHPLKYAES